MAKAPLLHSVQLDERMRRGDVKARPRDKAFKALLDVLVLLTLGLIVLVLLMHLGIVLEPDTQLETYALGLAALTLLGGGFLFQAIRWRALRGSHGAKILEKWKADLQLTVVSILALFTVIFILVVEVLALLVFIGVVEAGEAGARFADQFILFQAIILLVHLMAFVVRETNLSSYQPKPASVIFANVLTPIAGLAMVAGVLLGTGIPQDAGLLTGIAVRQAVYILTLGVGLEFIAMRIRLRLPSVYSLVVAAIDASRRANEEVRQTMQKRAIRTYVFATLFVAGSMAFAGAMATGNLAIGGGRTSLALVVFYVGVAIILLGLVAVRSFQARHLQRRDISGEDELSRLVGQKRRSAKEIARMSIYVATGILGAAFLVFSVVVGSGEFEGERTVTVTEDGEETTETVPTGLESRFATDFFLLGAVTVLGPYGYFFNQERKRIEAIDQKFPDFLRDLAESARAGMTLPRALVTAAHGTYGALTEDINKMAAQVEWGVEFGDALERFAQRTKTPLIDRTVALVVEAQRAGGNVVDVLTAASDDAREIKQIIAERNEQMKMYSVVVFIAFFVFIAVVLVLSAQFIPAFDEAVGAASGQQVGGLQFREFDPEDFNLLFMHAAVVQAVGGALVGGVMTKGHPVGGFNAMFVMIFIAWFSFRVLIGFV